MSPYTSSTALNASCSGMKLYRTGNKLNNILCNILQCHSASLLAYMIITIDDIPLFGREVKRSGKKGEWGL